MELSHVWLLLFFIRSCNLSRVTRETRPRFLDKLDDCSLSAESSLCKPIGSQLTLYCANVQQVSCLLQEFVNGSTALSGTSWRGLVLDGCKFGSTDMSEQLVTAFPHLKRLSILQSRSSAATLLNFLSDQVGAKSEDWPTLKNLIIRGHNLPRMPGASLAARFPNLRQLDLSQNRLSEISGLNSFTQLKHLNLSHNRISLLPLLPGSVRDLDLSFNWLTETVPEKSGISNILGKLHHLNLSNNAISVLPPNSFDNFPNLHRLNLANNQLSNLPGFSNDSLRFLYWLNLSGNPLKSSLSHHLVGASNLKELVIEDTHLVFLHTASLTELSHLEILRMAHNRHLTGLYGHIRTDLPHLRSLYLNDCGLETLESAAFEGSRLTVLNISGNRFGCDCSLQWLAKSSHLPINASKLWCFPLVHGQGGLFGSGSLTRTYSLQDGLAWLHDNSSQCGNLGFLGGVNPQKLNIKLGEFGLERLVNCRVHGSGSPTITWFKGYWPQEQAPLYSWDPDTQKVTSHVSNGSHSKISLHPGGTLVIREFIRSDIGVYRCTAFGRENNVTATFSLRIDYSSWWLVEVYSVICSIAAVILSAICHVIWSVVRRGVLWRLSTIQKTSRARMMIETLEKYKQRQMDSLHEKYTQRVTRLFENYHQQVENLRQSYAAQSGRLRDIKAAQIESVSQHIDSVMDNYHVQRARLGDYCTRQMDRLWDSYQNQRSRIRTFTLQQRVRLIDQYRIKQRLLDKILRSLNLDREHKVEPLTVPVFAPDRDYMDLFRPLSVADPELLMGTEGPSGSIILSGGPGDARFMNLSGSPAGTSLHTVHEGPPEEEDAQSEDGWSDYQSLPDDSFMDNLADIELQYFDRNRHSDGSGGGLNHEMELLPSHSSGGLRYGAATGHPGDQANARISSIPLHGISSDSSSVPLLSMSAVTEPSGPESAVLQEHAGCSSTVPETRSGTNIDGETAFVNLSRLQEVDNDRQEQRFA